MIRTSTLCRLTLAVGLSTLAWPAPAAEPTAFHIHLSAQQRTVVSPSEASGNDAAQLSPGLLIVKDGPRDRWWSVPARDVEAGAPAGTSQRLAGGTRGDMAIDNAPLAAATSHLDQLASGEVLRGAKPGGFITPVDDARQLNPRITLRRAPLDGAAQFPADQGVILRGREEVVRFTFPEGKNRLKWSDIVAAGKPLSDGLPPGRYLIKLTKADADARFEIAPAETRQTILARHERLERLLAKSDKPLATQVLVETLLRAKDAKGRPTPFTADAYDLLEGSAPTPYLAQVEKQLAATLQGTDLPVAADDNRLPESMALARQRIARGQWTAALEALDAVDGSSDPRARMLVDLYRGVVLAESGAATHDAAEQQFAAALAEAEKAAVEDRQRVHNNFANYCLRRTQDRLYNHAMRAASGTSNTLFDAVADWQRGLDHYDQALALAAELGPEAVAAGQANLARHYAVLADLVHLLNAPLPAEARFQEGETAAIEQARFLAQSVLAADSGADHATRAAAAETLAQLAHRDQQEELCRTQAREALAEYTTLGSILGAEGIYRMLGLSLLSDGSSKNRAEGIRSLRVSLELAEFLREQFPADTIGLSRAGFLARRAYVSDRLVEALLASGDFKEALAVHEAGKARSLGDVLQSHGVSVVAEPVSHSPDDLLAHWPDKTIALEYFLGPDEAWVFCIRGENRVTAHRLLDSSGEPIKTVELVSLLRRFLSDMDGAAGKMLRTASPSKPFDDAWQHDLHRFYEILIPREARTELAGKELVVVPQHLLHYFPFAALVTKLDEAERGPMESAMPAFLIEQGMSIVYAPSLAAWQTLRSRPDQSIDTVRAVGIASFAQAKPLPGVKDDLTHIRKTFAASFEPAKTSQVTEQTLYDCLVQPGLVYIGTHGANVADHPLASYLLCQADASSDGRLMAGEVYGSRLKADVVVLGACYSGLADQAPLPGDDLFGLERALLHSGVSTVVAGLWDIYDETGSNIVHTFFNRFAAGRSAPSALAEAQRDFLQTRRKEGAGDPWIHPYFWAVYKVSGSDRTSFQASRE